MVRYNYRVIFRFRATVGDNGSDQRFFRCAMGFWKKIVHYLLGPCTGRAVARWPGPQIRFEARAQPGPSPGPQH